MKLTFHLCLWIRNNWEDVGGSDWRRGRSLTEWLIGRLSLQVFVLKFCIIYIYWNINYYILFSISYTFRTTNSQFPFQELLSPFGFWNQRFFISHGVRPEDRSTGTFWFLENKWVFMSIGHLWYQLSQFFFSFRIFWISELWLKQSPGNKIEHQYPGCGCELNSQGRVELQRVGWARNSFFTRFSSFIKQSQHSCGSTSSECS